MPVYPIEKLSKYRRADTAVLLGSGSSINRITPEVWEKIRLCDTLALNNWVYHPFFVPDFYMIEVKGYDYPIVRRRLEEKQEHYQNCNFIFPAKKMVRQKELPPIPLESVVPWDSKRFVYRAALRNAKRKGSIDARYRPHPVILTKSYDVSITIALELLWRMKYNTIVLYGVDLLDSFYFWSSGASEYGEVHHLTNKAHEGKDPTKPHATAVIKGFITDFSQRWMWGQHRQMYIGDERTLLHPEIPLIDWSTHEI